MSNRSASDTSDSISLFPFLAVLLCTMGALLVLLVILVQRAAQWSLLPDDPQPQLLAATEPDVKQAHLQENLQKDLDEVAEYQKQLSGLQAEANRRLEEERLRLSHVEDHTRRLQEELAKLAITVEQLELTEKNQAVDQEQAEREAARLEKLVEDTQKQIENLREAPPAGKKSYAILPYKGPNGTFRKPIYVECCHKGVILQPEGITLTEADFVAPTWPGNPLASALRASREYLNNKAAEAGAPEPPDPYPLIIVRPSGLKMYTLARAAITAWDGDYGYEFIEEDMKLSFREPIDSQLARVQTHAIMISRERLMHLVQSAPSRFRGMRLGKVGNGSGVGGNGYGLGYEGDGQELAAGSGAYNSNGGSAQHVGSSGGDGAAPGEAQIGSLEGNSPDRQSSGGMAGVPGASTDEITDPNASGAENLVGSRYAPSGSTSVYAPSEPIDGKDSPGNGNSSAGVNGSQITGSMSAGSSGSSGGAGGSAGMSFNSSQSATIADSRGSNWAVNEPRQKSMAIRRSIHVSVRDSRMTLAPVRGARRGAEATGREISLDQSIHDISDQFKEAIDERIAEWGLAGSGMYWRPVLELNVEPNAEMTATRIAHLLRDSGVEVRLPETAHQNQSTGGTIR